MKNNFVSKTIAIFLTFVFIFGLIPTAGFAEPSPKGFNKSVFDSHFSRADRELNPELWLSEAKLGISQAIYAWEIIAFDLYEDPLLFEEAKAQIKKWSDEGLEERFSKWLRGRFFGDAAANAAAQLTSGFAEIQKNYSWRLDDEGNIVFDDKTGDPLIIRPGEEGREFSQDLLKWQGEAENLIITNIDSLNTAMICLYPELLAYIPAELRETMNEVIMKTGSAASRTIKREFENIAAREESIFTSRRTRDIWSLRRKSDDEAARIFTEKLIIETEESTARGINELNARIEQASSGTGDLAILGEEWLQLYREHFERGLNAWQEAEERFFIRRIEWEQDALRLYSEGEDTWLAAFNQFEEGRQKWELNAKELFKSGENLFKSVSEDLEKSITAAKEEFEKNMKVRAEAGKTKAQAMVEIYLTCVSAAGAAKESTAFWLKQYNYGEYNIDDPSFAEWLDSERKSFWLQAENSYLRSHSYMVTSSYLRNLESAMQKAENDLEKIKKEKNVTQTKILTAENAYEAAKNAYDEYLDIFNSEHAILFQIQDIIAGKTTFAQEMAFEKEIRNYYYFSSWSYSNLCEVQKSYDLYSSYFSKAREARDNIAADFSELFGSGILKDILDPAVSSEDFCLDEYQIALINAKTLVLYWEKKTNIAQAVTDYANAIDAGRITEAEGIAAWEKAKDEYNAAILSYEEELKKLNEIGIDIEKQQTKLNLLAARLSEAERILAYKNNEYKELVSTFVLDRLGVTYKYEALLESYKYQTAYTGVLEYGLKWEEAARKENIKTVLDSLDEDPETDPLLRLAAADFFNDSPDYSGADWYFKTKNSSLSEGEKLYERLIADFQNSSRILLEKRFEAEIQAFENVLGLDLKTDTFEDIYYLYKILSDLKERIETGAECYTEDYEENETIDYFLSGGSFFPDLNQNLAEYYDDYNLCFALLYLYDHFGSLSYFVIKESWQESCVLLENLFKNYGLAMTAGRIPDAKSIGDMIYNKPGSFKENTAIFLLQFDSCFSIVPNWMENEINNWKCSFINYILSLDEYKNNAGKIKDEKHWRQYLTAEYLESESFFASSASTYEEGVMLDALDDVLLFTNRLNDAFALYSKRETDASNGSAEKLFNLYQEEYLKAEYYLNCISAFQADLALTGKHFDISRSSDPEKEAFRDQLYNSVKKQEEAYNSIKNEYFTEAENFYNIGSLYDSQYGAVKTSYDNAETKRYEYEVQDAIRRWASTAYLDADIADIENCKNKLEKSKIVLDVLCKLYNDEEKRPYDNPEYNALYSKYEQNYAQKLKILEAIDSVSSALKQEESNIQTYYNYYHYYLNNFGQVFTDYSKYFTETPKEKWEAKDIITVKDGRLVFNLNGVNEVTAKELEKFFTSTVTLDGEKDEITTFVKSLRELTERMAGYFTDPEKYETWGFAREYFLYELMNKDTEIEYLKRIYTGLGQMESGGSLIDLLYKTGLLDAPNSLYSILYTKEWIIKSGGFSDIITTIVNLVNDPEQKDLTVYKNSILKPAWDSLSKTEKADLEYYIILTLSGSNYYPGFSQFMAMKAYDEVLDTVEYHYRKAKAETEKWYGGIWNDVRSTNLKTLKEIEHIINETQPKIKRWKDGLSTDLRYSNYFVEAYRNSCANIDALEGEKKGDQSIVWEDIKNALTISGKMSADDIASLETYWTAMQKEPPESFNSVSAALLGLKNWAADEEEKSKNALDIFWTNDKSARQDYEEKYNLSLENFLEGTAGIEEMKIAAEKAYGSEAAAWKNHYENKQNTLLNYFSLYPNYSADYYSFFAHIGNETASLIKEVYENRYLAELAAREVEWDQMRRDINEKEEEWKNSAALILETGRTDWENGSKRLQEAYRQWAANFQNEYRRVNDEWNEAYLAGLEDKEAWLEQAASAANQASIEAYSALIGAEGERLSRLIDTREPFGIRDAVPQTEALMANLLQGAGINNMADAFNSINGISGSASVTAKRGMGGFSAWDSSLVKATASEMAKTTNAEIAEREAKMMARNASQMAAEAINSIHKNIASANSNFSQSMDDTFILNGLWRKSGYYYVKDVVMGSTLSDPLITERKTVEGYKNYRPEPFVIKTNVEENYLAGLNSMAIMELLERVNKEVKDIVIEIFGTEDGIKGKFQIHIGEMPEVKDSSEEENEDMYKKGVKTKKETVFVHEGSEELGRLMSEFIYWSIIDSIGSAELKLAPWDKRFSDADNFLADLTLRSVGQIVGSIVVTAFTGCIGGPLTFADIAISVGISSASEVAFGVLDAAFKYKTPGEAAFNIGKTLLTNTASNLIPGVFNGIGDAGSSFLKNGLTNTFTNGIGNTFGAFGTIAVKTSMAGLQAITVGTITSAINGITYNSRDGLGYSKEAFKAGMESTYKNSLVAMTNTAVNESLAAVNSGANYEKLSGFSRLNEKDIKNLNNLTGSLAGQGVNYLMGNDFTLNILNLGLLTGGKWNSGLLELHLGDDGASWEIGTGGANVSIDNLASAIRGIKVWDVNNRIEKNNVKNDYDLRIAMRAQFGFGDTGQKDQLWDIFNGKTEINLVDDLIDSEGNLQRAETTTTVDGKRIINLAGYSDKMSIADQMFLAVVLGHDAHRDGIVTDNNNLETRTATTAHTQMAQRMVIDGHTYLLNNSNLASDIFAYSQGSDFFNNYVDNAYNSTGDYWKLTKEGNLEYDGFATLRDANGNILRSFAEMGLKSDNSIEGALLWLLNVNSNDKENVDAVRTMMVNSGLLHSSDENPNNWVWKDSNYEVTRYNGSSLVTEAQNIIALNMGKTISLNSIAELFTNIDASGTSINTSVNRIYGSAIGFLNYADAGGNTAIADSILSNYYNSNQMDMIKYNQVWLNNALKNGVNINSMVIGNAKITQEFGKDSGDLTLKRKETNDPYYFWEIHTGIDYAGEGKSIQTPGGYWELSNTDNHKAYYQLYGSDVKMRIQHINPEELKTLTKNTIYGDTNNTLLNYPTASYGAGTGAHIHIDMTMNLPYNGTYVRQFVNPETLQPGNRLEYAYAYKDNNYNNIQGKSGNFWRY